MSAPQRPAKSGMLGSKKKDTNVNDWTRKLDILHAKPCMSHANQDRRS